MNKRVITAVLLVPVVLVLIFLSPPWVFAIASAIMIAYAAWEWLRLIGVTNLLGRLTYLTITIACLIASYFLLLYRESFHVLIFFIFLATFVWWLFAFYCIVQYERYQVVSFRGVILSGIVGLVILVPCWFGLNVLRFSELGKLLVTFLLFLIWMGDTSAYFIGMRWGDKKLTTHVSPKKTVVGIYGELATTFLVATIGGVFFPFFGPRVLLFVLLAFVAIFFSIIGDLFMSFMKRKASIKDSGNLLPGHGGLLDRIDSLIAASPIFVLGLILLGMIL